MNTQKTPRDEKASEQSKKIGVLAGMLLFVIQGLRKGSIKSKPILNIDPKATEYGVTSLEQEIWSALNKCGITEKKNEDTAASRSAIRAKQRKTK